MAFNSVLCLHFAAIVEVWIMNLLPLLPECEDYGHAPTLQRNLWFVTGLLCSSVWPGTHCAQVVCTLTASSLLHSAARVLELETWTTTPHSVFLIRRVQEGIIMQALIVAEVCVTAAHWPTCWRLITLALFRSFKNHKCEIILKGKQYRKQKYYLICDGLVTC